jgi:hypothetical protein
MSQAFTLLHPHGRADVEATTDGDRVLLSPDAIRDSIGWELKDEGLCRGDDCVPVSDRASLVRAQGLDLAALAGTLGLPLAVDAEAGVAAIGTTHTDRAARLASGEAPDFELPDLDGKMHSLSQHRGKKVLLIAYASW